MIRTKCEKCGSGVSGTTPCRFCAEADRVAKESDEALAVQLERILASGRLDAMLHDRVLIRERTSVAARYRISAETEFKGVND